MAKIIYWESPIDPNKKRNMTFKDRSIREILEDLKIEHESLGVSINGVFPDELDLSIVPKRSDVVEIIRVVNGSNDAEGKNTLATIISIAALVAATVLTAGGASPYLIAGISLIGGVASGALRYRAAKIIARSGGADKGDIDVSTNNYSISAAANEARALQPLTIPMGSHRYAPDYCGQPYGGFSGGVFTNAAINVDSAIPPVKIPDDLGSMETFPAGYLSSSPYNWPPYPLRIIDEIDLATINSLTSDQKKDIAPLFPTPLIGVPYTNVSMPIVLYHNDLSDPYYGRFTLLAYFANQDRTGKTAGEAYTEYEAWFDNAYAFTLPWYFAVISDIVFSGKINWKLATNAPIRVDTGYANIQEFTNQMLNGGYTYPTLDSGFIPFRGVELTKKYTEPQSRDVIHTFNFGIGDMTISDRAIEKTPFDKVIGLINDSVDTFLWSFPGVFTTFPERPVITNVKILEGAELVNNTDFSGPARIIAPSDQNNYNFIFRATPKKCFRVEVDIEGQLYATDSSGVIENTTTLEFQYRDAGDTFWTGIRLEEFRSASTLPVRRTVVFNFTLGSETEFRIRKLQKDTANNEESKIAALSIISFKCFVGRGFGSSYPTNTEASDLIGQQAESLLLVANSQTSGQTNKFSAQVDTKCWVYDPIGDDWNWELSRNPAWWFLYFARGGFKNQDADGSYVFPWSPTYGWVNGPGHPSSTETMFGCGLYDEEIDIDMIKQWAVFCDDQDLYFDAVFRDDSNSSEVLEKIANVGRGSVSYYKGVLGVVYEDPLAPVTGLYGMGNILDGSFSVDYSVINIPSKVEGDFSDRADDWQSKRVDATVPFADPENLNFISIGLDGVTELQQAQREVNILAARQYFQKRLYSWKVDHEGLIAKRGDLVYLSHDTTQYGWSGRIVKFLYNESSEITGLETTSQFKDTAITHVTIREPNGNLNTYECSISGCNITFIDEYPINLAPQYPDGTENFDNTDSDFDDSYPDDFIFLAGPKETPGKIVRISEIKSDQNMVFTISAVDEDPAMWSYEYGPPIDPESFDDSEIVVRAFNAGYQILEPGVVKIFWETDGTDLVKIINTKTGLPIEANGAFSFSGGEVIVELTAGSKYTLSIEPFVVSAPYAQKSVGLIVWP